MGAHRTLGYVIRFYQFLEVLQRPVRAIAAEMPEGLGISSPVNALSVAIHAVPLTARWAQAQCQKEPDCSRVSYNDRTRWLLLAALHAEPEAGLALLKTADHEQESRVGADGKRKICYIVSDLETLMQNG